MCFFQLAKWLINEKKMNVFVEEKTLSDSDFDENNEFPLIKSKPWSGLSFCRFFRVSIYREEPWTVEFELSNWQDLW